MGSGRGPKWMPSCSPRKCRHCHRHWRAEALILVQVRMDSSRPSDRIQASAGYLCCECICSP